MTLQSASALWWLLPVGGAILALYLLRMRRRDVRVPAAFLWPRVTADVRANAPFQRLRPSLLLFLQLLVAALLVFGLANPLRKARGLHGRATVVVLDASASMAATDVAPSRFEAARRRVLAIVDTMGSGDQLALVEAGPVTRVVFPLTNDKARMTAALRPLRPADAPASMGEALRLAAALVGQRPEGRIVVLSDGTFSPVSNFSPGKAALAFERVGSGANNVAITAFDAASTPAGIQLYAGVRNYGATARKATLTFVLDGEVVDAREITVPPRQTLGQTLTAPATGREAEVRLVAEGDILKADNQAALFLQGAGTVRALLVSPGNLFLERALALQPSLLLDRAPAVPDYENAGAAGEGRYDLVIFDGVPADAVKAPAVWSFGGVGPDLPVEDAGPSARPKTRPGSRAHPVLRNVDLDNVLVEKGRIVRAQPEGRVLVDGTAGPMVVASQRGGRRALYVAWNLLDSDLPLQVSFPILVSNAVAWLAGEGRVAGGLMVRPGQPFSLPAAGKAKTLVLRRPDGTRETLDASSGVAVVRSVNAVGRYVVQGGATPLRVAANLLSDEESDVAPRGALQISGQSVAARGAAVALADTWRPLALLALLVLACEWWVFVRRS